MRRGPKETPMIEYARAAYWVCNLSYISGKPFTELEKILTPWAVKKRDGGGFIQPYAFKKYAIGHRVPRSKGDKSPVNIAEQHFPGSILAFKSILWEVINIKAGNQSHIDLKSIFRRVNPYVIKHLRNGFLVSKSEPLLNELGKAEVISLNHIDAFALLLLTIRYNEAIKINDIHNLQSWLLLNSKQSPFSMRSNLLLSIFEEIIPEVGVMTGPQGYIEDSKNRHMITLTTALTCGRAILM